MQLRSGSLWLITYPSGKQYIAQMWYNGTLHIPGSEQVVDFAGLTTVIFLADSVKDLVSRLQPQSNIEGVSFLS